jgi:hypothetical protein
MATSCCSHTCTSISNAFSSFISSYSGILSLPRSRPGHATYLAFLLDPSIFDHFRCCDAPALVVTRGCHRGCSWVRSVERCASVGVQV